MSMKKLPIGIDDFEKLRKWDYYYVDKTGLIADLLDNPGEVNLFTRPRRFGKSLNMSMLQAFFEHSTDKSIFEGLKISEDTEICRKYMGKFPVVSVSLKGVEGLSFDAAYEMLRAQIRSEAFRLEVLRDSQAISDEERAPYMRIIREQDTAADIASSLQIFCKLLEKHYGQKTILLIDEYDVPLDKAYVNGYYPQMAELIRSMFGAALKTNTGLQFAVLTGCLRVSKESIFTGLNNLKVHSVSDAAFDEYFGFTDAEVRDILAYYGLDNHYDDVRNWYDGYRFGGQFVYCPWDVINYCYDLRASEGMKPKPYWVNTSSNDMIRRLIDKSTRVGSARRDIEKLIEGETITKPLNENLTHNEIDKNIDNIWSLLYMTGYLTITDYPEDNMYTLCIPNNEIREIYKQQVSAWFRDKIETEADKLTELYAAFEAGDSSRIEEIINAELKYTVSFHDAYETFYHGFMLALLSNCAEWDVVSNRETGRDRSDIMAERNDYESGFVTELKVVRDEQRLEATCNEAIRQIEDMGYTDVLLKDGVHAIRIYGIAFCNKKCRVITKKVR